MKKLVLVLFMAIALISSAVATGNHHFEQPECPEGSTNVGVDNWANSVYAVGGTVDDPDESLGPEDNVFAVIDNTHPDSYLVVDMGEGEEVWDWLLLDLVVYGDDSDESAWVYVSNDASTWYFAGFVNSDEQAFVELPNDFDSYRYVKVVNPNHHKHVEVDAVKGKCITEPRDDEVPEFSVVGAGLVLAGAGLYLAKKKKN